MVTSHMGHFYAHFIFSFITTGGGDKKIKLDKMFCVELTVHFLCRLYPAMNVSISE